MMIKETPPVTISDELLREAEIARRNKLTAEFMRIQHDLAAAKAKCAAMRETLEAKLAPFESTVDAAFKVWLAAKAAWSEQTVRNQQELAPLVNRIGELIQAISELTTPSPVIQWQPVESSENLPEPPEGSKGEWISQAAPWRVPN
jgi:hypothetical protein